ncbi:MAG: Rpn family recombination-promoting nuclease/putative transposase [Deltaproteobacteria bacterium]|nr:Rpn family recombination-promoting nuclease/putative transposase [Deltaproteobacteria bacterium]
MTLHDRSKKRVKVKSDRGVFPVYNDVVFKILLNDKNSYGFLFFLITSIFPHLNIQSIEVEYEDKDDIFNYINNKMNLQLKNTEIFDPYSITEVIHLDIHCKLNNGENIIIEMRAFPQQGDSKLNDYKGLRNRDVIFASRVHSTGHTGTDGKRSDAY